MKRSEILRCALGDVDVKLLRKQIYALAARRGDDGTLNLLETILEILEGDRD